MNRENIMRTISLYTKDEKFVANVEIPMFDDDLMPQVVTWEVRTFLRGKNPPDGSNDYFEIFAYAAATPSPGLAAATQRCVRCGETDQTIARSARQDCPNDTKGVHGWMPLGSPEAHRSEHAKETLERWKKAEATPVDMNARARTDGGDPNDPAHRAIGADGMQQSYIVLSEEERAKGFVRPVRRSYIHEKCGTKTTMSTALAETYSREPAFYDGTFCTSCKNHFPVGPDGEFVWAGTDIKVGT